MKIRGILFDKDGTLVDFDRTWLPAYHKALDEFCKTENDPTLKARCLEASGYDADKNCTIPNSPFAAEGNDDIVTLWFAVAGKPPVRKTVGKLVALMEEHSADHPAPLFDTADLLGKLAGRDMALGIATMDAEWAARRAMQHFGVADYFSFYAGYDSGLGRKPGPGMANSFCEINSLQAEEIMVVGDNLHDLHMAKNAGAGLAVGVCSGVARREDLSEAADHVIDDATEITGLLDIIDGN